MEKQKSGAKASFAVTSVLILLICNLLSRVFGFLRDVVLSYKYGTSDISDTYYMSNTLITVIFFALTFAVSTAYLPIFAKVNEKDKLQGRQFHNTMFSVSLLVSFLLSLAVLLFARPMVSLFARGFSEAQLAQTTMLVQLMAFSIFFNCFIQLLASFLQYKDLFLIPGMNGAVLNLCYIFGVLLSDEEHTAVLGLSFTLAHILVWGILFFYARRHQFRFSFRLRDESGHMREAWLLIYPLLIGNISGQIDESIDKALASGLETGVVSALNYANKIQGFIIGVFVTSVITVAFPKFTRDYAVKDLKGISRKLQETSRTISGISIPVTFGLVVLATQIISLVFMRGSFDERSVTITAGALIGYAIGLPFASLRDLYVRTLFAMQDSKSPIIIDAIGVTVNVVLNLALVGPFSYLGLAFATSIANIVKFVLLTRLLNRRLPDFLTKGFIREHGKLLLSSCIMCVVVYLLNLWASPFFSATFLGRLGGFLLVVLLGFLCYAVGLALLRSQVYGDIRDLLITYWEKLKAKKRS